MKQENIFTGNIMKCTQCDNSIHSTPYKQAIIIYIKHLGFIDLDNLSNNKLKNSLKLFKEIISNQNIGQKIIMQTAPSTKDSLWVDATSLQPYYYPGQKIKNVKVKQLKLNQKGGDIEH